MPREKALKYAGLCLMRRAVLGMAQIHLILFSSTLLPVFLSPQRLLLAPLFLNALLHLEKNSKEFLGKLSQTADELMTCKAERPDTEL